MENFETMSSFEQGIELFKQLFQITPELVVHDLHPDYFSTRYAMGLAIPTIGIQHHFAHALSCMAEYGSVGPGLAIVMDGTGYGEDGTVWGGEFLEVTVQGYRRLGHLKQIPLPGGDKAATNTIGCESSYKLTFVLQYGTTLRCRECSFECEGGSKLRRSGSSGT